MCETKELIMAKLLPFIDSCVHWGRPHRCESRTQDEEDGPFLEEDGPFLEVEASV